MLLLLAIGLHATDIYPVSNTGSMAPTFDENYFLMVEHKPWAEIQVGDIIIYRPQHPEYFEGYPSMIVHRVVARSSRGGVVLCKGDNNKEYDPDIINETQYVGTVVHWIKREDYFRLETPTRPPKFTL